MQLVGLLRLAGSALVLGIGSANAADFLPGGEGRLIGRYLVGLHEGPDAPETIAETYGLAATHVYRHALRGFAARIPDHALARILVDLRVDYVEPDGYVWAVGTDPGDGERPGGDGDAELAQVTPWGVLRVGGPRNGSSLKTAWVIDSGIDLDHPDLNVDTARSANFVPKGENSPDDGNGHGTHVAGTTAAIDNSIDVVGVAAGASVVAVRVLDDSGDGQISWVIAGVDYVASNANVGDVVNMSLGTSGHYQALHDAVTALANDPPNGAGALVAIAAGNSSKNAIEFESAHVIHKNVYTVSASDSGDCLAWFSNYGNPPIAFAAPGVEILSTKNGGGVTTMSGTSMAAPHVAGILLSDTPGEDGQVCADPDGLPDPIAHYPK